MFKTGILEGFLNDFEGKCQRGVPQAYGILVPSLVYVYVSQQVLQQSIQLAVGVVVWLEVVL